MKLKTLESVGALTKWRHIISAMTRVSKSLTRVSGSLTHVSDPGEQVDGTVERACAVEPDKTAERTVLSAVRMDNMSYAEAFLEWVVHLRVSGEQTTEEVEKLAREFESFAGIASINSDALFKGLASAGIKPRVVDLKPSDPSYAERRRRGVQRPRIRLYSLPVSEASVTSRSREMAPRKQKPLFVLGWL